MYGLPKVHKKSLDGLPPFRPILSAIGTAKFLVEMLKLLTTNSFTVKDSFSFAEDVRGRDQNLKSKDNLINP